ncbi:MAG: class I SAM-dependent methyltransferase [Actinomycetota bacterium]
MNDWRTYDDVADAYERIHAPRLAEPARDLVALAAVPAGGRVLDVGTGTGVAAEAAAAVGCRVIGVDESIGMLRVARGARPAIPVAAARVIDLPFRDGTFDAVVGSFVLAHFTKYQTALYDMLRVLRPGGRLALTAWADHADELSRTWRELVESVVPPSILDPAMAERLPWHDRFRDREPIEEALMDAGMRGVRTEIRRYRFRYAMDEYVEGLSTWATGRFVRSMLGEPAFGSFMEHARAVFTERFADPVNDFRDVVFATAAKP